MLKNEIKANALSVHSNLGGSQHGNLGLVISPEAYAHVSNTPYDTPVYPAELVVSTTASRHVADHSTRTHTESLRVFHEVCRIERTLFQQLVAAVDPSYLAAVRDRTTGQFSDNVYTTIQHLIFTYGCMSPSQLNQLESDTKQMTYDPATPVGVVFNSVLVKRLISPTRSLTRQKSSRTASSRETESPQRTKPGSTSRRTSGMRMTNLLKPAT